MKLNSLATMIHLRTHFSQRIPDQPWLTRLARDTAGNTMMIVAATLAPLLALVGGGIDMGRGYLAQSRLQQACDAGVLAARKRLGSTPSAAGSPPADVEAAGQSFFNVNFRNGAYGTRDRKFAMTIEADSAVSGEATVTVPTAVMKIFGNDRIPLAVACEARLNFSNSDVMLVLDTTGSMNEINPGDDTSRIAELRTVVKQFYNQIETAKTPGTRVRYGFVPYSTNVNVGQLLQDDWVVSNWDYQSRVVKDTSASIANYTYTANWQLVSGSESSAIIDSYPATYHAATSETGSAWYSCDTAAPTGSMNVVYTEISRESEPYVGPPAGTKTTRHMQRTITNTAYFLHRNGTTCEIWRTDYNTEVHSYDEITIPRETTTPQYEYRAVNRDVANWRTETNGCIEERATYEIEDYTNVDLNQALDLDLDRLPDPTDPDTQWRPRYPNIIYERSLNYYGTAGSFTPGTILSTAEFMRPANFAALVACPAPALKMTELSGAQIDTYLASLRAIGTTYHDIGMIWGGRLISPTGLFAAENADIGGKPTNRNLIFLTDGQTEPYDVAYGAYGVEPLDRRRWRPGSAASLVQTVESRFSFACNQVKNRNVTVWVIGFGTDVTELMKGCAGPGHWFQAADATELSDAFNRIAKAMGDLRITR